MNKRQKKKKGLLLIEKIYSNYGKKENESTKKKEVKNFDIKTSDDMVLENKKNMSNEKDNKIKTDLEDSKSVPKKLELINQEYNNVVKNLMISKRELNTIKKDIEKSNEEYDNLILKTKAKCFFKTLTWLLQN